MGRKPVTSGLVLGFLTSPSFLRLVFGGQLAAMRGQHQFKPCQEPAIRQVQFLNVPLQGHGVSL